ncbi:MAG: InlB B-repeat-containing protein [Bacilli bacterium]|jgi:hypothetical protein|nr:InlB B-repeat-containing protein [Bacilli bacterium]MCH4278316.1 InlB B-repeat-containing protein [Bacilli bacterium]
MKNNKRKLALACLSLFASLPLLGGCSGYLIDDGSYTIADITTALDDDGNTVVTITFNEDKDPVVFTIDKGTSGANGNGIANISAATDENGNIVLTITYTDPDTSPTEITIPLMKGENGISVVRVEVSDDTNGNKVIVFVYSDGTKSDPITIPKGNDGVGIADIKQTNNDDGSISVTVTFTDSTRDPIVITIPAGPTGVSITDITCERSGNAYVLHVTFSDGSSTDVPFDIPTVNTWLSGTVDPDDSLGQDGDFYMNTANGGIFKKENGSWTFIVRLWQNATSYYYVVFNPNGGSINGSTSAIQEKVKAGEYIVDLPTPTLTSKVFQGWWTSTDSDPNAGHFTSLTPVFANINLYARWSD